MKKGLIILIMLAFDIFSVSAQTYIMSSSASYTTCFGNFYCDGGTSGEYVGGPDYKSSTSD